MLIGAQTAAAISASKISFTISTDNLQPNNDKTASKDLRSTASVFSAVSYHNGLEYRNAERSNVYVTLLS